MDSNENNLQKADKLLSQRLQGLEEIAVLQESAELARRNVAIIRYLIEKIKIQSLGIAEGEDILISQVIEATDIILESVLAKCDPDFRDAIITLMQMGRKES